MAQVKREVFSAGSSGRGLPGQAVWLCVGRTKLLADDQASDWLQGEPGALSVMYSMLSVVRCCSQGNRRGFLGFPPRVSQPPALCGIPESAVLCCAVTELWVMHYAGQQGLQNNKTFLKNLFITCKAFAGGEPSWISDSLIVHYKKPNP